MGLRFCVGEMALQGKPSAHAFDGNLQTDNICRSVYEPGSAPAIFYTASAKAGFGTLSGLAGSKLGVYSIARHSP